ncbi:MAG: magnesium-translocating P-type ATPase [Plesiomonas sp.]|uniref:magnesium-translocating P-type ATPase n=1 Tax=Plesiomonas sp. TaxID=2486279 RepID=UPI003F372893
MQFNQIPTLLVSFLTRKLPRRLVARDSLPTHPRQWKAQKPVTDHLTQHYLTHSDYDESTLFTRCKSHPEGLTEKEVREKQAEYGENMLEDHSALPWWKHLWHCYRNPFNLLLTLLAIISYATEDIQAVVVIATMVLISTFMHFIQESRSNKAADKLKAMVSNTATVLRSDDLTGYSSQQEIPMSQLVPGDIVKLSAGDMIPADLCIIKAKDLFISQASLTGESIPVEKSVLRYRESPSNPQIDQQFDSSAENNMHDPLQRENLCFMGTNVVSGTAIAVVIGTGKNTYFGTLAERVIRQHDEPNAFQTGLSKVSWLLIRFMLVMTPVVLLINGFTKGDWWEAALFALSVAVGLTPEMLPMIVTSTLARGAVKLSKQKVIVKRLDAIQNFGAMDVLCTDKTGTLTQDKIVLERHTDIEGKPCEQVLRYAWLNSYYQTGLKNLLDVAVLEKGADKNLAVTGLDLGLGLGLHKVDEIPFDFERRRMSVVVRATNGPDELICKGALEEILAVCTHARINEEVVSLSGDRLEAVRTITRDLNQQGLRVVAVASKTLVDHSDQYCVTDEYELILEGYIAFLDPPKETTAPALSALKANGIQVKILTGDNELVAAKVCHDVGLDAGSILLGTHVDQLSDVELASAVTNTTVFAKLTPLHKERIVQTLRAEGHVVGFMGDGINDAPALRAADIGISVDSAVDIAKEAADIILLEKSLMVLEQGVLEGRKTFANMLKYIKITASSNFGNVFSVLIASAFLPFLPMLPIHLLIQNLLYDISQVAIPFDNVDDDQLTTPQRWNTDELGKFMLFFGPISSIFDVLTYCLMWYVFKADNVGAQTLFQSGWFVEGLLSQTLIVHMIRTRKIPFLQSRPSWILMVMTMVVVVVGIGLVFSPLAPYLQLEALPLSYFPWLLLILSGYMVLTQTVKRWFVH